MGFDFYIKLRLSLCETTGKPCFYDYTDGTFKINYDVSSITVPEEYRRFLTMRGHYMQLYTQDVDISNDCFDADISQLLEVFPEWKDIESSELSKRYEWTEKDHNAFHEALKWFNKQKCAFYVSWSY